MKKTLIRIIAVLPLVLGLAACEEDDFFFGRDDRSRDERPGQERPVPDREPHDRTPDKTVQTRTATLFVATDRHETGSGNNLTAMLQRASNDLGYRPGTVLLGGDYVGGRGDMTPEFSIKDLYDEVYSAVDPLETRVFITYGSHDNNCTDGYGAFDSGPRRCDGYYVYGITYVQMVFDRDSSTLAAIQYYLENGDQMQDPPPPGDDTGNSEENSGEGEDSEDRKRPPTGAPKVRGYNGIDQADRHGISAESATESFTKWVSSLSDHDPIVVMSHVPMHANRNDNPGGLRWFETLSSAAGDHDILFLWGHNHTLEEGGNETDRYSYLLTSGDSIDVQGDSLSGVVSKPLNFTYANAGYLKLGYASTVTFTGSRESAGFETMTIRRHSLDPADTETGFGLTGKENPYTIKLKQ